MAYYDDAGRLVDEQGAQVNPIADPTLGLRRAIAPDEEKYTYGNLLPMKKNKVTGGFSPAMPLSLNEFVNGIFDLLHGTQTGELTPRGQMALYGMMGSSSLSAPRGALGSMGGRLINMREAKPKFVKQQISKMLDDSTIRNLDESYNSYEIAHPVAGRVVVHENSKGGYDISGHKPNGETEHFNDMDEGLAKLEKEWFAPKVIGQTQNPVTSGKNVLPFNPLVAKAEAPPKAAVAVGFVKEAEQKALPPHVAKSFEEAASMQRGAPEEAMVRAQMHIGGGVLPYALEHVGDLTHRMSEMASYGRFGGYEKVEKMQRLLNHPYGFEKEMGENFRANSGTRGQPYLEYQNKTNKLLENYAAEHKKIPVYNEAQYLAREAAVALGEKQFSVARSNLNKLKSIYDSGKWDEELSKHTLDPNGQLLQWSPAK